LGALFFKEWEKFAFHPVEGGLEAIGLIDSADGGLDGGGFPKGGEEVV